MVEQIHPQTLAQRIQAGESVYFVDVRQQWEHDHCAFPDSLLIPLNELPQRLEEVEPPEGALVVVYCHHGIRSLSGTAILQQAGITPVVSLMGGIDAWSLLIDPKIPRY